MSPVEWMGFVVCLVALCFLLAFGLVFGAWAAIQAGAWAFGPISIGFKHGPIIIKAEDQR